MKLKQIIAWVCTVCLCLSMCACSDQSAVYVQSVEDLMRMGGIAPGDRFAGLVVSENVTEIHKDADKSIKDLPVKEGDDVVEGQPLFSYDTEQLQLNLDKQKLELTQMYATIESYNAQIATLQQESASATGTTKLQYTIEIQSTQLDLKEARLRVAAKEEEVKKAEQLLENATVVSPVSGRIQNINSSGTDNYGNPAAFITIQQVGSYRIKGILGELQRGGLMENDRVTIHSRTDDSLTWSGTVTLVDYESPSQGSDYDRYYGNSADEMTTASKYPFYVQPD
ncbi:MAG: efflux RND transporter periplasmic adaptor subunit, partial [Oscillospiraceae bacterium]|nr:efflux RND transporter periplasmic adaptor subunit [Oscillospiraceae bacterium]